MIAAWSGGVVARGSVDVGAAPPRRQLTVRPERATKLLDVPETAQDIVESLGRIGIGALAQADGVRVEVPSWRVDLEREVDVIEDVIRVQGYDRVGATVLPVRQSGAVPATYEARRRARTVLVRAGLRETRSYSFASPADLVLMGDDPATAVAVRNPLSADDAFLRTSLLPGLLRAVRLNVSRQVRSASLFEVGHVFRPADGGEGAVEEREPVAGVFAGRAGTGLRGERRPFDFFDAKGAVEALMEAFGVSSWGVADPADPADPGRAGPWHPARRAAVAVDGRRVGHLGELHPRIASQLDLPDAVVMFEVDLGSAGPRTDGAVYRDVARFPPVRRDLAFVVDAGVPVGAIGSAIVLAGAGMADAVELFDVFEGPPLAEGTKNAAFSVEFRAPDRTLTDAEVTGAVERIARHVRDRLGGELRTG
jgi:phenylalanyl-tRNA synthetase beta chain